MLGIFIPGPDLSKSGADAWAKSQVDPVEKARRKARKIEKSLTSVGTKVLSPRLSTRGGS